MVRSQGDRAAQSLRATLDEQGYVEVETPVLQLTNGGAAARPFRTHLNAFDQEMLLRIALELDLKRAMVGGVDRVYEIGKTFRNEGIDSTHAAEFSMLEAYQAYGDYESMMELVRDLVVDVGPSARPHRGAGARRDGDRPRGPWRRATLLDLVSDRGRAGGHASTPTVETLRRHAAAHDVASNRAGTDRRIAGRALRAAGRAHADPADLRLRLSRGGQAAGQAAPFGAGTQRGIRPRHQRRRAGPGLFRAQRPGGPARAAGSRSRCSPPPATLRPRPRRGFPACVGAWHATGRWHRYGCRPAGHAADGNGYSRVNPVSVASAGMKGHNSRVPAPVVINPVLLMSGLFINSARGTDTSQRDSEDR